MALPVSFADCIKIVQQIQRIAEQVQINKRLSHHLAWRVGLVSSVLAQAQGKSPSQVSRVAFQLTTLKGVLDDAQSFLTQFLERNWLQQVWKRVKDSETFLDLNQRLDACSHALQLELMLGLAFPKYNPMQLEMNNEEDAEEDTSTITQLQAEVKDANLKAMLAEWRQHLDLKRNLSNARKATTKLTELKRSELEKGRKIGQGGFGTVYEGLWHGSPVAIKELTYIEELSDTEKQAFRGEAARHADLRHPRVVQFFGACTDELPFFIVMELMSGGSLQSLIRARMKGLDGAGGQGVEMPFPTEGAKSIMLQIAKAMVFLHNRGVVHRDLKTANVLVRVLDDKSGACEAKVTDFGLAEIKSTSSTHSRSRQCVVGTFRWTAPEIFDDAEYTVKADVYSFAMTCLEILTGAVPFKELKADSAVYRAVLTGRRPELPHICDHELRSLLEDCWQQDPESRPDFEQICSRLENGGAHEVLEAKDEKGKSKPVTAGGTQAASLYSDAFSQLRQANDGLGQTKEFHPALHGRVTQAVEGDASNQLHRRLSNKQLRPEPDSPRARYVLACQCESNGDQVQALRHYAVAAKGGLLQAQIEMGNRYLVGNGVVADESVALEWVEEAAKQGDTGSLFILARCNDLGKGTIRNVSRASECYASAASMWGLHDLTRWFKRNPHAGLRKALRIDKFRPRLLEKVLGLDVVILAGCSIEVKALVAALEWDSFPTLQMLDLSNNPIQEAGAQELASTFERIFFPALQTLNLSGNLIKEGGAEGLAAAILRGSFPKLKALYLSWNKIGDAGAMALAAALERSSFLQQLCLDDNSIGVDGAKAIAAALEKGSFMLLRELSLDDNSIEAAGAKALAAALTRGSSLALQTLSLDGNSIGEAGAKALAVAFERRSFPALQTLGLSCNSLGEAGAKILAGTLGQGSFSALQALSLSWNKIGDAGVVLLAAAFERGSLKTLQSLYLDKNSIGDVGVEALAGVSEYGVFQKLQRLSLDDNLIREAGAKTLAVAFERGLFPALRELNLSWNKIGEEGAKSLAGAFEQGSFRSLQTLYLSNNSIGDEGVKALAVALDRGSLPAIENLDFSHNSRGERKVLDGPATNRVSDAR